MYLFPFTYFFSIDSSFTYKRSFTPLVANCPFSALAPHVFNFRKICIGTVTFTNYTGAFSNVIFGNFSSRLMHSIELQKNLQLRFYSGVKGSSFLISAGQLSSNPTNIRATLTSPLPPDSLIVLRLPGSKGTVILASPLNSDKLPVESALSKE